MDIPRIPQVPLEPIHITGLYDVVVIFFLGFCALWGVRKGLAGALGTLVGVVVARLAAPQLAHQMARVLSMVAQVELGQWGELAGTSLVGVFLLAGFSFGGMAVGRVARSFPIARQTDRMGGGLIGVSTGAYLSLEFVSWVAGYPWGGEILAGSFLLSREADLVKLAQVAMSWVDQVVGRIM